MIKKHTSLDIELQVCVAKVEHTLRLFFKEKEKSVAKISASSEMIKHIKEFCLRKGKRLRPFLMLASYQLFKGVHDKATITIAASLELLHNFFLIHDDVIDESSIRRNGPTLNKLLGTNPSILAGDLCCSFAFELICKTNISPSKKTRIMQEFYKVTQDTIYGQELDVRPFGLNDDISEQAVVRKYILKTARYTFEFPLCVGALLAGKTISNDLKEYAMATGIAFQINNDLQGIKQSNDDLLQSKLTFPIICAFSQGSPKQVRTLQKLLKNERNNSEHIRAMREILESTNSISLSRDKVAAESKKAFSVLNIMKKNEEYNSGALEILTTLNKKILMI